MARKTNAAVKEATAKTTAAKAAAVKETTVKEVPATASEGKSAEPAKEAKKAPARKTVFAGLWLWLFCRRIRILKRHWL